MEEQPPRNTNISFQPYANRAVKKLSLPEGAALNCGHVAIMTLEADDHKTTRCLQTRMSILSVLSDPMYPVLWGANQTSSDMGMPASSKIEGNVPC
ncbi:predicted protein [Uncinocarpus reesii 1704]|uniref:Uncharacterized protein n=1 Tax=Uncinocarpus reesii (strain UAMH 1704) TaxID=336963 RepID=C4JWL9_UNCRE|nr:uncharacterized protein UREG_06961 [Uncinocarpus reesii 1704]EEP82096.1 predicted protein [Uncinocarpus reesii 1704]